MQGPRKHGSLLFLADSHGRGLKALFRDALPRWKTEVEYFSGYTAQELHDVITHRQRHSVSPYENVIIHVGTNNFFKQGSSTHGHKHATLRDSDLTIINNTIATLNAAREWFPGATIIYSANLPRYDIQQYAARREVVSDKLQQYVRHSDMVYADHTDIFQDKNGTVNKQFYTKDGLHLSSSGKYLLVKNIIKTIEEIGHT